MRYYATSVRFQTVRSVIALVLCLALTLQGCGSGGTESGSTGTNGSSSAGVTYSTQDGKITQLSITDSSTGQSGSFDFSQNATGQTMFASGNIATPTGNFTYSFDSTGALRKMTNQTSREETQINYFTDHIELLFFNQAGINAATLVVYSVSNTLVAGLAQPGIPYTFASLTNKVDVTTDVKKTFLDITGDTAPLIARAQGSFPSFNFIPSAFAQNAGIDLSNQSDAKFVLGYAGGILISGILIAVGTVAAFNICGPLCGALTAVAITTILATAHAKAAQKIVGFNGTYRRNVLIGGDTHTELNTVLGSSIAGSIVSFGVSFGGGTSSVVWSGTLTRTSATSASIAGSGTITNFGVRNFTIQSGNVNVNPDGSADMYWIGNDPRFGPIGGTSHRTP